MQGVKQLRSSSSKDQRGPTEARTQVCIVVVGRQRSFEGADRAF